MSSNDLNIETYNSLKQKNNNLKAQCKESYLRISNNTPIELTDINDENKKEKILCYVDGLRADLEATETPLCLDKNLLTLQFVNDLSKTVSEVEQLLAYKQGAILDLENETLRLQTLLKSHEKAKTKSSTVNEVKPEHVDKAKEYFKMIKTNVHGLIHSLFASAGDDMIALLGKLVTNYMDENSDGYIEMEPEDFHIAEMLKEINLVKTNPYNKQQIKICLD